MTSHSSNTVNGVICGVISALIWGAFPVVTRLGVGHASFDKYDITAIRFGISGLILLPFFLRQGLMGVEWTAIALLLAGIGPPYMLVVSHGLTYAPVQTFSVITPGSMIVFSVVASTILLKDKLPGRALAGIILVLAGIISIGFEDLHAENLGIYLIFVLGGLLWATYTMSTRVFSVKPFHATTIVSVFSMATYVPFYCYFRGLQILEAPVRDVLVQVIYQGILVSIVALFFYSKAVHFLGPAKGSVFAAFVPGASVVLASIILGELPGVAAIVGICVVTVGMLFALYPGKQGAPAPIRQDGKGSSWK
jgi:drug/metabolite transporter (DMT)-like permease